MDKSKERPKCERPGFSLKKKTFMYQNAIFLISPGSSKKIQWDLMILLGAFTDLSVDTSHNSAMSQPCFKRLFI